MFRKRNYNNNNNKWYTKNNDNILKTQYCIELYYRLHNTYPHISLKIVEKLIGMVYENSIFVIKQLIDNENTFKELLIEALKVLIESNKDDKTLEYTLSIIVESNIKDKKNYLCEILYNKLKDKFSKFSECLVRKIVGMINELDISEIESCITNDEIFLDRCKESLIVLREAINEGVDININIDIVEINTMFNYYFLNSDK